jgi:hypothetical protein
MGMFRLQDFAPVALTDKDRIQPLLLANDVCFCDYSFANLFMWGGIYTTRWLIDDGRLWLYNGYDDLLLMPVGKPITRAGLLAASDDLRAAGKSGNLVLVDRDFVADNPGLEESFAVTLDLDNGDYIYSSRKLADLPGNKLQKKRNLIHQFLGAFPDYSCQPLQAGDLGDCLQLAEKWCRLRTCLELDFTHETSALRQALENFAELELSGLKVCQGSTLLAFSVFSRLNSNMADVHFEKFDPLVKGASQVINWETAKLLSGKYKYINREQDLGIEGLRRAKQSYEPEYIVSAYSLERKK